MDSPQTDMKKENITSSFLEVVCFIQQSANQEDDLCYSYRTIDNRTFDTSPSPEEDDTEEAKIEYGDIPVLNRKISKARRVTIREHPYIVSIRRKYSHYLTGSLISKNLVLTVAHPIVDVPINELGAVVGENYSDRGIMLLTVIIVVIHDEFDPYTLAGDIAILRFYEEVEPRSNIKHIHISSKLFKEGTAIVTGWGRCDFTGKELCLPRSSEYYPEEILDPMLRSVSFPYIRDNCFCKSYKQNGAPLKKGMICLGLASTKHEPCLAVPGAPLVVEGNMVALQSWGYGCGYPLSLPLVYTHIYDYLGWIINNIEVMQKIDNDKSVRALFKATRAYTLLTWLKRSRPFGHNDTIRDGPLEAARIDNLLARLDGKVYDIRDYIRNKTYQKAKQNILNDIRESEGPRPVPIFRFNPEYIINDQCH
ncbi:trypsin theta-like [Aricia agestis]|uniref:trypsin theta-like n=1 Tax=Aricia agestis TaxID=91739 RepID=UPI001C2029E6|nr:trypsin theta-like [Aricia agestis]